MSKVEIRCNTAAIQPGVWYKTKDRRPEPGMLVKRWKSGAVWAGMFSGNIKDSTFDEWMKLPT